MPAKKIVILDRISPKRFRYVMWFDVPAARQAFYAQVGKVSQWTGASAQENADLASGAVVEKSGETALEGTVAEVMAMLQSQWQETQNEINNFNPWVRYGTFWDGTSWNNAGVI